MSIAPACVRSFVFCRWRSRPCDSSRWNANKEAPAERDLAVLPRMLPATECHRGRPAAGPHMEMNHTHAGFGTMPRSCFNDVPPLRSWRQGRFPGCGGACTHVSRAAAAAQTCCRSFSWDFAHEAAGTCPISFLAVQELSFREAEELGAGCNHANKNSPQGPTCAACPGGLDTVKSIPFPGSIRVD